MASDISISADERRAVQIAKDDIKLSRAENRAKRLRAMRVVGVTCAATAFPILQDNKFPIVILDEASQMVEPMSLLPIAKFGCERLIAVGDPKQLPPTLPSLRRVSGVEGVPAPLTGSSDDTTLAKTMFVRLQSGGLSPVVLRTQYRCHPEISAIPNALFYRSELKDGVTAEDRSALIRGLNPMMICDVPGGQEKLSSVVTGSFYNEAEMVAVCGIVKQLLSCGISRSQIGVIALYKAQVFRIQRAVNLLLSECDSKLQALNKSVPTGLLQISTVDAFQGAERAVMLVSCVRSAGIGFADSPHRLNVALTRATHHCVLIGCMSNLRRHPMWSNLISRISGLPGDHYLKIRELLQIFLGHRNNAELGSSEKGI
eukprot:747537_1